MAYENKSNWTLNENKPNSNPISNFLLGIMTGKFREYKYYDNKSGYFPSVQIHRAGTDLCLKEPSGLFMNISALTLRLYGKFCKKTCRN